MTTRRHFLKTSTAALAAPLFLNASRLFGAEAQGRTIRLGHIGVGDRGTAVLQNFLSTKGAISAAIADPFRQRREAAAVRVKNMQGHEPILHNDFRDLLADDSIDAVIIATPDHWHVPIGIAALRAGKDIYVEKPLGLSMDQNKAMLEACQKSNRIFQYGTQQRSVEIMKRGVELVLNGYIGDLERIDVWAPKGRGGGSLEEIPVPEGLDYDLYIGPAPMRPCTKDRITNLSSWFCRDYAVGFIAGWGAHPLDIAIWGQDYDQQGPFKVRGTGKIETPDALFNTISSWDVHIEFAGGIKSRFMSSDIAQPIVETYRNNFSRNGTTFFGSKGWVSVSRDSYAASNPEWFRVKMGERDKCVPYHKNYSQAFVDAVRDRTPSIGPIQDAVRSDAISHLSAIAIQSGEEVVWDPKAYRILSPEPLNKLMSVEARAPWQQV